MALAHLLSDEDVLGIVVQYIVREQESDTTHVLYKALLREPEFTRCPIEGEYIPNVELHKQKADLQTTCLAGISQLVTISKGHKLLKSILAPHINALAKVYVSTHQCSACECSRIRTIKEITTKCARCGTTCICTKCSEEMLRDTEMKMYPTCCYWNDSVNSLNDMLSDGFLY